MAMPRSERRLIENEMIFRRANEKVGKDLKKLDAELIEDDYPDLMITNDLVLDFLCECSDENCADRIPIKLSVYQKIHTNRDAFIVKHTHEIKEIEKVIRSEDKFIVVEKNKSIDEPSNKLNKTSIKNK